MNDYNVYLSDYQKKKIRTCYNKKEICTLRLDLTKKNNTPLKHLNHSQINNIENAKAMKQKTVTIKLSPSQTGGIIPLLALIGTALGTGALTGVGSYVGNKIAEKIGGKGMKCDSIKKGKSVKKTKKSNKKGKGVFLPGKVFQT